jgi:hypothetical protein
VDWSCLCQDWVQERALVNTILNIGIYKSRWISSVAELLLPKKWLCTMNLEELLYSQHIWILILGNCHVDWTLNRIAFYHFPQILWHVVLRFWHHFKDVSGDFVALWDFGPSRTIRLHTLNSHNTRCKRVRNAHTCRFTLLSLLSISKTFFLVLLYKS